MNKNNEYQETYSPEFLDSIFEWFKKFNELNPPLKFLSTQLETYPDLVFQLLKHKNLCTDINVCDIVCYDDRKEKNPKELTFSFEGFSDNYMLYKSRQIIFQFSCPLPSENPDDGYEFFLEFKAQNIAKIEMHDLDRALRDGYINYDFITKYTACTWQVAYDFIEQIITGQKNKGVLVPKN